MYMKKVLIFILILVGCTKNKINQDLIVKNFDINKYLGIWYEIARIDNRFERNLKNVKAEYILLQNNKIKIINSGYDTKNEKNRTITGYGYIKNKNLAQLKISFFRPFYSDYNIIILDKNYNYVVVSGDSYDYLWILSRKDTINTKLYNQLLSQISNMGFDINKIIKVN